MAAADAQVELHSRCGFLEKAESTNQQPTFGLALYRQGGVSHYPMIATLLNFRRHLPTCDGHRSPISVDLNFVKHSHQNLFQIYNNLLGVLLHVLLGHFLTCFCNFYF